MISRSSEVVSSEFVFRVTVARPKSTIHGSPFLSINMFACANHREHGSVNTRDSTHSFEVSMNHIACVKVKESIGNTERLMMGQDDV